MPEDWVKGLAELWGQNVRRFEARLGSIQGTMGRIREEGPEGAAIRSYHDHLPYTEFPREVRIFHRAYMDLKPHLKAVLWVSYKVPGPLKKKIKKMGVSRSAFYRRRAEALNKIAANFYLYQ